MIQINNLDAETCSVAHDGYELIIDFSGDSPEIRVWEDEEYPTVVFHVPERD